MEQSKCKICRRSQVKLFLKGEKCLSPRCPMIKRPYPPGQKRKKRGSASLSEYGKELREKQKIKNWYNLSETQFRKYVKEALENRGKTGDVSNLLIQKLEKRLDNIIFRLGFSPSHSQARQLVSHGHFLVNGKSVNIPSFNVKIGDKISVKDSSKSRVIFKNLPLLIKKYNAPIWVELDKEKLEGSVKKEPTSEDIQLPAEISTIFGYYSR